MPLFKAQSKELADWLEDTLPRTPPGAVLLFGDPYQCRELSGRIEAVLLAEGGTLHPIDGEEEDAQDTMNRLATFSLLGALGGRQVYRVNNSLLLQSKKNAKDLWDKVEKARTAGQTDRILRALGAFVRAMKVEAEEDALTSLSAVAWKEAFDFDRPSGDLGWTVPLLRALRERGKGKDASGDPGERLAELLTRGLPPANRLILLSSGSVDKRKKLYKYLEAHEAVIDCSAVLAKGGDARKAQDAVLRETAARVLSLRDKRLAAPLLAVMLERVGFHPAALENELEKLCLFVGERREITRQDVDELVGRTREEAVFELSDAVAHDNVARALVVLHRVLASGNPPQMVMGYLRNHVRMMLLFKALSERAQPGSPFAPGVSYQDFQRQSLPALLKHERWGRAVKGKSAYPLYNQFREAARRPLPRLLHWMRLLYEAERRFKRPATDTALILHRLLVAMLAPKPAGGPAGGPGLAKSPARITIQPQSPPGRAGRSSFH